MKIIKYILFGLISLNLNNAQEVKLYNESNSPLISSELTSLAIDSSNSILVGSYKKQLYKFSGSWEIDTTIWDIAERYSIDDIAISPNGTIWTSLSDDYRGGIYYYSENKWKYLAYEYGLYWPGNIYIENDSTFYYALINSWPHGLHADQIAIFAHDSIKTINFPCVNNVLPFTGDTLLVASCAYGITKYDGDSIIAINPEEWQPLYATKIHDQIFVFGERLSKFEKGFYIDFPKVDSVLNADTSNITSIAMGADNVLWIGTDKGKLIKYNKNIEVFEISDYGIREIEIDKYYNIWFISYEGCYVFNEDKIVKVEQDLKLPTSYSLSQNYPNPFNPTTTIQYTVQEHNKVNVRIFDINGQMIKELLNEDKSSGNYLIMWNGLNDSGVKVASGTYFYQIQTGNFTQTKKMILLK
jgi:ligand-binding sensor domain-containing protein